MSPLLPIEPPLPSIFAQVRRNSRSLSPVAIGMAYCSPRWSIASWTGSSLPSSPRALIRSRTARLMSAASALVSAETVMPRLEPAAVRASRRSM